MQIHGIIPPVATPMQANEDLDLPRLQVVPRPPHRQRRPRHLRPRHQQRVLRPGRREKQEVIATAVAHVRGRVPVYRRHRRRDDARGGAPDEDGREGRRGGRLGHHAVLRQPDRSRRSSTTTAASPRARRCRSSCTTTRRRAAASRSTWTRWPGSRRSRTSSASRIRAATCRTRTRCIRVGAGALQRADGPRHAHLPGADVRRGGAVPATGNIAPHLLVEIYEAFQRGDLEASKAAPAEAQPGAAEPDARHRAGRRQGGAQPARPCRSARASPGGAAVGR